MRFCLVFCVGLALVAGCTTTAPQRRYVVPLNQPSVEGLYLAGAYAAAIGDSDTALFYYSAALNEEQDNAYIAESALTSAMAAGDFKRAKALARRLVHTDGAHERAALVLAADAMARGRYGRAIDVLERTEFGPFNAVIGAMILAWAYEGDGQGPMALDVLQAPAEAPILGALTQLHAAMILDRNGLSAEAGLAYRRALRMGVLRGSAIEAYGRYLERQGQMGEAQALYLTYLADEPHDPLGWACLARLDAGLPVSDHVASPAEGAALGVYGPMALVAAHADPELVAVYLQLALFMDPNSTRTRLSLADVYVRAGHTSAALAVLDNGRLGEGGTMAWSAQTGTANPGEGALGNGSGLPSPSRGGTTSGPGTRSASGPRGAVGDAGPGTWPGMTAEGQAALDVRAARLLAQTDQDGAAIARLTRLAAVDPSGVGALALGQLYLERRAYDEALALFDGLLDETPDGRVMGGARADRWVAYVERARAHRALGNEAQAIADLEMAFDLAPDQPGVMVKLGQAWIDQGDRAEAAYDLMRRAVALSPNEGGVVAVLGRAYFQLGEYDNAVRQLERAVVLSPDDPMIKDYLGDAYWQVGRRIESSFQWSRALDLDPSPERRAGLVQKLELGLDGARETRGGSRDTAAGVQDHVLGGIAGGVPGDITGDITGGITGGNPGGGADRDGHDH